MSEPVSVNASMPLKDENKINTEICSWRDPILNLFFKHRIILRDSHFGGQKVVADGMEEVMKFIIGGSYSRAAIRHTYDVFFYCVHFS